MTASSELVLVEDDSDGGCSWCPVVTEGEEDESASVEFWTKGEELRKLKNWARALECFSRGLVANPRNAACWLGISKVCQGDRREARVCVDDAVWPYCFLLLHHSPRLQCLTHPAGAHFG